MERKSDNKQTETLALNEVEGFVKENIVPAVDGRVCVDGRYDPEGSQKGFLARAGADFGLVMGLLGLSKKGKINLTPEEAVDSVYSFVTAGEGKFYLHTDRNSIDGQTLTGCGHIRLASNSDYSDRFGVSTTDMLEALSYIRDKKQHPNTEEVILQGNHEEKGNLITRGEKTLNHKSTTSQYFVYDKDRDIKFVEKFVESANILGLTHEDLQEVLDMQTKATLDLLAPENPTYEVDLYGEIPKITLVPANP